ncbi:MAG: ATP-binding cassette domain-containing protein, partial [Cyanobacteria bacterium NC_groundwater_1444_Ag_S-0.65um_54_12]|nr:ATP-binding cassette domain-containing protein [Cyanobacteria bacterium NC_groundwater_1444_Ag_S-0.65um_54_12]
MIAANQGADNNILELRAVHKMRGAGARAVPALRGVSLAIAPGELVLLEGPSGSGKTTLLAVAAGLLTPDAGQVFLAGARFDSESSSRRRENRASKIGFVFQRANLLSELTVWQNIMLGAVLAGLPRSLAKLEVEHLLTTLSIATLATRRPSELSGGEEQRVAVARALIHRPVVILADEPTG